MADITIYCSKCGSPMRVDARYCMKCGEINYDHPDNQYMKKYRNVGNNQKVYIKENINMVNTSDSDVTVGGKVLENGNIIDMPTSKGVNYGSRIVYNLVFSICVYFIYVSLFNISSSLAFYYSLYIFSMIFLGIANLNIYQKIGYSPFVSFIPFYNNYLLCDALFDNGLLFILQFIPIVNIVFGIILMATLGKKFGVNSIVSVIFFPIVFLLIAYSNRFSYLDDKIISSDKFLSFLGMVIALVSLVSIFWFFTVIS